LERPSPWLARGADLVVYSGGKFLRGPQTSGLLLGRKDLVQAAWHNAAPHQALGRPMKVSKEDVIGVLTAVDIWINRRDPRAEEQRWRGDLAEIAGILGGLPEVECEVVEPSGVVRVPALLVRWNAQRAALNGPGLRLRLLDGTPRVMIDDMSAGENHVTLDPFALQPGEAREVGHAIARALSANQGAQPSAAAAPALDLSGEWDVLVEFLHGARTHRMHLAQAGAILSGNHVSAQFQGRVDGNVSGADLRLVFADRYEGSTIAYQFTGKAADGSIAGTVVLGTSNDHHQGEVNLAQFGTGRWWAERVG
jgi:L-seryl-tRNA(Ser) seleniumtransferase